jgi:hypothetical protein
VTLVDCGTISTGLNCVYLSYSAKHTSHFCLSQPTTAGKWPKPTPRKLLAPIRRPNSPKSEVHTIAEFASQAGLAQAIVLAPLAFSTLFTLFAFFVMNALLQADEASLLPCPRHLSGCCLRKICATTFSSLPRLLHHTTKKI